MACCANSRAPPRYVPRLCADLDGKEGVPVITLISVNGLNLYGSEDEDAQKRFAGIEALIRDRDPDFIAVLSGRPS